MSPPLSPPLAFQARPPTRDAPADEDAAVAVPAVLAGSILFWVLGWVPLTRGGGGESRIISPWRATAERGLSDERHRSELGSLTMVFAMLARRWAVWQVGLRGWNMEPIPFRTP